MGSANVSLSDPPSDPSYTNVWVTVDGVSASVSGTSNSGWVNLVSGLSSASGSITAVQVDLLNLPQSGQCLLAQLGSTSSLPPGDYQQIRLQLVPNNATGVTLLAPNSGESTDNQCANVNAWNCVMPSGTGASLTALDLSSEAQTGLKIPPGQIIGGPISVAAGKSVDINIDFNAGRSIVPQGNGHFRLVPVLLAFQTDQGPSGVSQNLSGISGLVVQNGSTTAVSFDQNSPAVPGANVALELDPNSNPMNDTNAVDLIGNYLTTTDTNGKFDFCPLPSDTTFDVVVNAGPDTSTTGTYNATIITGVPASSQASTGVPEGTFVTVPLLAESSSSGPGTLTGTVSATPATGVSIPDTLNIFALQKATTTLEFADPLFAGSNPTLAQFGSANMTCPSNPTTSDPCTGSYTLVVPASDPIVGAYTTSGINWTFPTSTTSGNYDVEATCTLDTTPPSTASVFTTSQQNVTPGNTTTVTPDLGVLENCE